MNAAFKKTMFTAGFLLIAGLTVWSNQSGDSSWQDAQNQASVPRADLKTEKAVRPYAGFQVPDFTLSDLEGNQVTMSSLRGKKVFVNFWASWCPPCKAETPDLVKLSKTYKGQVEFYGINLTTNDTLDKVQQFVKDYKIQYPVLLDEQGTVSSQYGVMSIPTSLTIDETGAIVDRADGQLSEPGIEELIGRLLKR